MLDGMKEWKLLHVTIATVVPVDFCVGDKAVDMDMRAKKPNESLL